MYSLPIALFELNTRLLLVKVTYYSALILIGMAATLVISAVVSKWYQVTSVQNLQLFFVLMLSGRAPRSLDLLFWVALGLGYIEEYWQQICSDAQYTRYWSALRPQPLKSTHWSLNVQKGIVWAYFPQNSTRVLYAQNARS